MLSTDHAQQIKCMDFLIRSLNDEELTMEWLTLGVPDGDINDETTIEEIQEMYDEDDYEDWQKLFCNLISIAYKEESYLC